MLKKFGDKLCPCKKESLQYCKGKPRVFTDDALVQEMLLREFFQSWLRLEIIGKGYRNSLMEFIIGWLNRWRQHDKYWKGD